MRPVSFDRSLYAFNWLTAAYADASRMQSAGTRTRKVGMREWGRLSSDLLSKEDLWGTYAERLDRQRWVLWRSNALEIAVLELGAAMLSRAICSSIERDTVEQWAAVLDSSRRQRALAYAPQFRALARARPIWRVIGTTRKDVFQLGASMLYASLPAAAGNGVRERFRLRFAHKAIQEVACDDRQRTEIEQLFAQSQRDGVLPTDCESLPWQ